MKYRREIATELESLDTNAFDAAVDTILLNIEKAEDAAHSSGDKGIQMLAVRDDTPPSAKGEDNDYTPLLVDATGKLYVNISTDGVATATNTKVSIGASDTQVLVASSTRRFAVFVNDSDEAIYLSLSATAVQSEGIRLNAGGGAYMIDAANLYTGEVSAICASGGKYLTLSAG